jgi:hypothetical protein
VTASQQRVLVVLAATIIILLLVLLYLVTRRSSPGGTATVNFDLPDLGNDTLAEAEEGVAALDDPGLWAALPGLLAEEK